MSSLTPTARVILGLLAFRPRTGYDIKQVTDRSTRFFWGASYGQIYPELRRLESRGLVRASETPRGRVRRRVYELTPAGRKALDEWLHEPGDSLEMRDEALLRLFFGELLKPEELRELVERRISNYAGAAQLFRAIEHELGPVDGPSGEVLRYGIDLMEWNIGWWSALRGRLETLADAEGGQVGKRGGDGRGDPSAGAVPASAANRGAREGAR